MSILLHDVIVAKDVAKAERSLLSLPGLKKYAERLKSDKEKEWFRRHLRKYIAIYSTDCPFEVTTTNRYTITTHEAALSARKFIKSGDVIKHLSGTLVAITPEEEQDLDLTRRDFSIVMSSRKKTPSLFLGPARFSNHDCNPNARLVTKGSESMEIVAIRDICPNDEITVSYGDNYFGVDNCECLCHTCEISLRNGWSPSGVPQNTSRATTPASVTQGDRETDTSPSIEETCLPVSVSETLSDRPAKRLKLKAELSDRPLDMSPASSPDPIAEPLLTTSGRLSGSFMISSFGNCSSSCTTDKPDLHRFDTSGMDRTSASSLSDQITCSAIADDETSASTRSTSATSISDFNIEIKQESPAEEEVRSLNEEQQRNGSFSQSPRDEGTFQDNDESELSDLSASWEINDKEMTVEKSEPVKRKTRKRKSYLIPSVEHQGPKIRIPGDYTKTPKLLAQRYDRWVDCQTCSAWFVQGDSYLTRKECPRCERHSKLYGYRWPKTDKEGRNDKEKRVMDHRTIHRFLTTEDEARVLRRGRGVSHATSLTPDVSEIKTETDGSELGDERRVTRAVRRARSSLHLAV